MLREWLVQFLVMYGRSPVSANTVALDDWLGYDRHMWDAVHLGYIEKTRPLMGSPSLVSLTDKAINFIQGE